ncbi:MULTISPECIES: sialidase family protein [unclassified Microbulbifer]|uniref:sialidase family protein n=1 Tax=unclassified Microbulbifer TaxID=2619833 RepID=UPI0027E509B3|nr:MULTISPECIES: sialidase family protein [unclassified Microbulbifer]
MKHKKINRRSILMACAGVLAGLVGATMAQAANAGPAHSEKLLFDGGGGERLNGITYHSFRIPSLVRTKENTLIAFVEGRASNNRDWGNINVLFKRSTDNGATWSALDEVVGAGPGTWGNPTAVADRQTGTIWVFMSWNPAGYSLGGKDGTTKITAWSHRKVYVSRSTDDGRTWSKPADMTAALKPRTRSNGATWAWDAMGPGVGIQMSNGRLVIPASHRNIYSDDNGATWKVQRIIDASTGGYQEVTGEGSVVELMDGRLMRNDRAGGSVWERGKRRWVARGTIEGGFDTYAPDSTLLDPRSQGSILRYNRDSPARIIFLNSASTVTRTKMRVRISYDGGKTWPISRPLSDAPLPSWRGLGDGNWAEGGYSSMAKTADFAVGALIEVNENTHSSATSHRSIAFRKFNLPWILNGGTEGGSPNPYTPEEACGSGYSAVDSHALTGGRIYLLYNSSNGYNCVVTMKASNVGTPSAVSASLQVEGGTKATDSGNFSYYAGPVKKYAPSTCVKWGGSIGSSSWESLYQHCD